VTQTAGYWYNKQDQPFSLRVHHRRVRQAQQALKRCDIHHALQRACIWLEKLQRARD
jgi:hypothetical protein